MTICLGIDPGLHGALAVLYGDGRAPGVWPTPTLTVPKGKRRVRVYDLGAMWDLILTIGQEMALPDEWFCVVELAQAFPGQGVVSMFSTGYGYAAWLMALTVAEVPHQTVHPATWKRIMFRDAAAKQGKGAAIQLAKRLFPGVSLRPSQQARTDSDGMAEALLLAEYGRRLQRGATG